MHARFSCERSVQYYETDAMAVVHHSNHVRYFEEARVAWLRERGQIGIHQPYGELVFAVLGQSARYYRALRFDDKMKIVLESRLRGARLFFRYAIYLAEGGGNGVVPGDLIASGETELVPLTKDFRPSKLPDDLRASYRLEPWSDIWPPQVP